MNVPTINVVMSFEPRDLFQFLDSKTLDIFKESAKGVSSRKTRFFNNGPASNFLSLTHSFGFGNGDSPRLELEFIDPQETFEKSMATFTTDGMLSPESSLVSFQVKKLQDKVRAAEDLLYQKEQELIKAQEEERNATNPTKFGPRIKALKEEKEDIEAALEQAEDELDAAVDDGGWFDMGMDADDIAGEDNKVNEAIKEYNQNLLSRSVWISYGVGDYLENWCPPMVFNQAIGAEYDIGSGQPRKLKLIYDGADTKPGGSTVNILNKLGYKVLCTGESDRIFSAESMAARKDFYDKLQPADQQISIPYFKDKLGYSIHDVVTQVLTRFLQNATGKTNVLVLLPDLDKVLSKMLSEKYDGSLWENTADWIDDFTGGNEEVIDTVNYLEAARQLFSELGMKMVESLGAGVQSVNNDIFSELEDEVTNPTQLLEYLEKKHITVALSTNIKTESFAQALKKVFDAIRNEAEAAFGEGTNVEDFEMVEHVVNDYVVLSSLARKGLIPDTGSPLYVVGTRSFVDDFLYGQVAFKTEDGKPSNFNQIKGKTTEDAAVPPHIDSELNSRVSPLDILKGLDSQHIKNMAFYVDPSLAFSPFGFNAVAQTDIQVELDESLANKWTMPIFSLGTRNANVMELKLDMNAGYLTSLSQTSFSKDTYNTKIQGILEDDSAKKNVIDVLNGIDALDFQLLGQQIESGNGGAEFDKFKKYVDPFRGQGGFWWWSNDREDSETFDAVLEIFEEVNETFAEELKKAGDEDSSDSEFYKGMYAAFTGFINEYPRMDLQRKTGSDGATTISTLAAMKKFLKRLAIVGTVKTIPLFQLSSSKRTINKTCYVYAREPRFQGVNFGPDADNTPPFYIGVYTITGFRHSISGNNAYSEFQLARDGA